MRSYWDCDEHGNDMKCCTETESFELICMAHERLCTVGLFVTVTNLTFGSVSTETLLTTNFTCVNASSNSCKDTCVVPGSDVKFIRLSFSVIFHVTCIETLCNYGYTASVTTCLHAFERVSMAKVLLVPPQSGQ